MTLPSVWKWNMVARRAALACSLATAGLFLTNGAAGAATLGTHVVAHAGVACSGTLPSGTVAGIASTPDDGGYWIANSTGLIVACGDAVSYGQLAAAPNRPIVDITSTPDGGGYYLVASDGGVFAFGDASFQG